MRGLQFFAVLLRLNDLFHADNVRIFADAHQAHALYIPSDHADLGRRHADDDARVGNEHDVLTAVHHQHPGEVAGLFRAF